MQLIPHSDSRVLKSSDGCEIYAEATGQPRHPHVVLIHGMTFCGAVFDDFCRLPDMLQNLYVVRYDMRGHGRSGKPEAAEGHVSKLYADDFMTVVAAFGLKKPVLAAWSFGGTVAMDLAANITPNPISGVFYINSTSLQRRSGTPLMAVIMSLEADIATSALALQRMRQACFDAPHTEQPSFYDKCFYAGMQAFQPYAARRVGLGRSTDPEPYIRLLKEGKVEVFVYYGKHDALLDGAVLEAEMKETTMNVEVSVVENGCHAIFWQFPKETATTLIRFAKRVWQPEDMASS
ncbi:Alpha/Beta hydrolase protein [Gautieria morchelliformis]|nr:Alpha/Beta hydrolase protein [Gautieria morchelliformis]